MAKPPNYFYLKIKLFLFLSSKHLGWQSRLLWWLHNERPDPILFFSSSLCIFYLIIHHHWGCYSSNHHIHIPTIKKVRRERIPCHLKNITSAFISLAMVGHMATPAIERLRNRLILCNGILNSHPGVLRKTGE